LLIVTGYRAFYLMIN